MLFNIPHLYTLPLYTAIVTLGRFLDLSGERPAANEAVRARYPQTLKELIHRQTARPGMIHRLEQPVQLLVSRGQSNLHTRPRAAKLTGINNAIPVGVHLAEDHLHLIHLQAHVRAVITSTYHKRPKNLKPTADCV